ncbi:MAG: hypothetical protein JWO82_1418, partial [Akkermansiaceae bacterium]|nr:hypothetical protein [Akkermansiaceae bacterium]
VCEMQGFMPDAEGKGENVPEGRITVLEDSDGDGKADRRKVFLDHLLLPRAVTVYEDGVLFLDDKRLCWVKRKGLDAVGEVQVIDGNFTGGGNVEHKPNGLLPNLDNYLYLAKSDKRLRRKGDKWEVESTAFRGQWGIARDDFGRLYHNNNSVFLFGESLAPNLLQANPVVKLKYNDAYMLGDNRTWPIRVTPAINRGYIAKSNGYNEDKLDPKTFKMINCTAVAGLTVYRGTNFPAEWYGTAFSTEASGNLLKAIHIAEKDGRPSGSHPLGEKEFLASSDERFRPVNVYTAPDGSMYLLDMYHGIIQDRTYMTTYLRDQSVSRGLDKPAAGFGRIYRIRSNSGKLEPRVDLGKLGGAALVKMLSHPNAWHREMAQRLLVERKDPKAVAALEELAAGGAPVAKIHAFWTLEGMGQLKAKDLEGPLKDANVKVQASALWACTRLGAPELAKLEPQLVALKPAGPEAAPYLTRVLASIGKPDALQELASILKTDARVPFVREATISGIHGHEAEFKHFADPADASLQGLLDLGMGKVADHPQGPELKGEPLAAWTRGKALFMGEAACFGCHGPEGAGLAGLGPPLEGSEWVRGNPETLTKILLHGLSGEVKVAGATYHPDAEMPGATMNPAMTDQKLADIETYIRNAWGNKAAAVEAATVTKQREATKARAGRPWTAAELKP